MFCSFCGKEIVDNQNFCQNCGKSVKQSTPTNSIVQPISNVGASQTSNSKTPVGFILGLVSIIAWILPLAGYPVTICGIVFSTKQLNTEDKSLKLLSIIGLVLSIFFLVVTLINSILGIILTFSALN